MYPHYDQILYFHISLSQLHSLSQTKQAGLNFYPTIYNYAVSQFATFQRRNHT